MSEKMDIVAIGESLVELSTDDKLETAECLHKYFGGDVLAAAVAARRLGSKVGFITKLGNDAFKDFLISGWNNEGLDISQVSYADERNGLYFIARHTFDEKEVAYYRKKIAPAKLSVEDISEDYISNAKILYASGITQSLSVSAREAVKKAYDLAKGFDVKTAYDPNFNSNIWDMADAKEAFDEILPYVDIIFMSARHDMQQLLGISSVDTAIKYLLDFGLKCVVIKSAVDKGYYIGYGGVISFVDFYTNEVSDTTCSGDAFNGGFMHGLTNGLAPFESAKLASIVAGLQAKAVGAIKSIPYRDKVYSIFKGE